MGRYRGLALGAVLLVVGGTTAAAQDAGTGDRMPQPGECLAIELGARQGTLPPGYAPAHTPPPVVRLDSGPPGSERQAGPLVPNLAALEGKRSVSPRWRRIGTDTLQLGWSSGFSGVSIVLVVAGDSAVGRARTFDDVLWPGKVDPEVPVVARRVSCTELRRR